MTNFSNKYRPSTFEGLVGQSLIKQTLLNSVKQSKIANAYLFSGSRGVGKTSSARILSKSLNCTAPNLHPCGDCHNCLTIDNSTNIDVVEIDAASHSGVDAIRELCQRASYNPVSSAYKVYIIDEVHCLSKAASNALLKTIEEPKPNVVFILATTELEKLLDTVVSRCQVFNFERVKFSESFDFLKTVAEKENIEIDNVCLSKIVNMSNGGLRDALQVLEQVSLLEEKVNVDTLASFFNDIPESEMVDLLKYIVNAEVLEALQLLNKWHDETKEPNLVVRHLSRLYTRVFLLKRSQQVLNYKVTSLSPETCEKLLSLAPNFTNLCLLTSQETIRNTATDLLNSNYSQTYLESLILSLMENANTQKLDW